MTCNKETRKPPQVRSTIITCTIFLVLAIVGPAIHDQYQQGQSDKEYEECVRFKEMFQTRIVKCKG